jgi:hypothetical protein
MAKPFTATLPGGLAAGALDITCACVHWNIAHDVAPMRIVQSVAAGLLGRDAACGGRLEYGRLDLFVALRDDDDHGRVLRLRGPRHTPRPIARLC